MIRQSGSDVSSENFEKINRDRTENIGYMNRSK